MIIKIWQGTGHWGNGDFEVKIMKPTDIGYVLSLIRQSNDKN